MPTTIDQRLHRVLIELAENKELTARERLDAAKQLAEIKANKPKRTQGPKAKQATKLLG